MDKKTKELDIKDTEGKLSEMYQIERAHILEVLTNKINLMVDDELTKMFNKIMKEFTSQSDLKLSWFVGKRRKQLLDNFLMEKKTEFYKEVNINFSHESGNIKGYLYSF